MQFSFSASGTPAAVRDSINSQAKDARTTVGAWPVAAAVRDYVNAQLADAPADGSVSVKVDLNVSISGVPKKRVIGAVTTADGSTEIVSPATRLDGQPDVVGEDGLIHGDLAPDTGVRLAPAEPGALNVTGTARADRRKR